MKAALVVMCALLILLSGIAWDWLRSRRPRNPMADAADQAWVHDAWMTALRDRRAGDCAGREGQLK